MKHNLPAKCCGLAILTFLLAVLSLSTSAQTRGTISGRVLNEEGAGLSGITLAIEAYSGGLPPSPGGSLKSVVSDAEGNFQFTNLSPLVYRISVQAARGHVLQTAADPNRPQLYRIGDTATIRMTKGGVITGRVTNANGEPMVSVSVTAIRIRDTEGNKTNVSYASRNRLTDDRGVYRIYGLRPGVYLVVANLTISGASGVTAYGDLSPTYYPSSTRDAATEVVVSNGTESSGIDLRHRGDRGHAVSGKVIGGTTQSGNIFPISAVMLYSRPSGAVTALTYTQRLETESGFAMYGIADGEYEIVATSSGETGDDNFRSEPLRITVRGNDVTGLELRLVMMASIAGRVTLEPATNACDPKAKATVEEMALSLNREEKPSPEPPSVSPIFLPTIAPNDKGEFSLIGIAPGSYRLEPNLPNETLYVKSIAASLPPAAAKPSSTDFARSGILLKPGEKLRGVNVTIADGAASLRGKIEVKPGGRNSSRVRIHLVPAEPTAGDNVLRYKEVLTTDASFAFTNLAPGKYFLLAKAVADNESSDRLPSPVAWDAAERLKLRKEAEAAKNEIDLKACQRVKDHVLR